jgi:hypothetical protein
MDEIAVLTDSVLDQGEVRQLDELREQHAERERERGQQAQRRGERARGGAAPNTRFSQAPGHEAVFSTRPARAASRRDEAPIQSRSPPR